MANLKIFPDGFFDDVKDFKGNMKETLELLREIRDLLEDIKEQKSTYYPVYTNSGCTPHIVPQNPPWPGWTITSVSGAVSGSS